MGFNRFFTLLFIGNDKDIKERISIFDKNTVLNENSIVYEFSKRDEIKQKELEEINKIIELCSSMEGKEDVVEYFTNKKISIEKMTDIEYFKMISEDSEIDDEGNIVTNKNINGKYTDCSTKGHTYPFFVKGSNEPVFIAKKGDIDWDRMANADKEYFERIWDVVSGEKEPENDFEKENFLHLRGNEYFQKFQNKEEFVAHRTKFSSSAVVNENDEWVDMTTLGYENGFDWVDKYYDNFIQNLPDDKELIICFCTKW